MPVDLTDRLGLPSPQGVNEVAVPADIKALADAIAAIAAVFDSGPIASRVDQSPGAPGLEGMWYWASDAETLSYSTGVGWLEVYPALVPDLSVTAAKIADATITSGKYGAGSVGTTALADLGVTTGKVADLAVTAAKIAAALKPSEGAGAATEALRALGTAAGRAAAGTHAAQHASGGADPLYKTGSGSGTTGGSGDLTVGITHNLGVVPSIVVPVITSGLNAWVPFVLSKTTTTAAIGFNQGAAGQPVTFDWIAYR